MAKRKVKEVDFSKDSARVSIVTAPANGQEEVTILKSKDKENDTKTHLEVLVEKVSKMEETITNLEKDVKTKEEEIMAEKQKKEDVDIQKSIDDAVQAALKKEKEKTAELLKAKEDELADLKKSAEKKEKDELVDICKGYSFVEDAEKLAGTLFLCKSIEGGGVILETLEKARKAIKASLEKEIGTDEDKILTKEVPENISKTAELIKAMRKEGK